MYYLLTICYDPTLPADPGPSRQPEHARVESAMRDEGIYAGGAALMPPEFAPPIRVRGNAVLDGPYPETKELAGGFYVVQCADAADAVRQAGRIPIGPEEWIEVRQIALWHPA